MKILKMDTNQPTIPESPNVSTPAIPATSAPSILGTKTPSTVAFVVGVLLFFLPFVDIKCNNMSLQQVSGFQLATGFKMKNTGSDNSLFKDLKPDNLNDGVTKTTTNKDEKDPNLFAMIAMGLGILGLLLSFTKAKAAMGGAIITGVASAGALIGLMIDIKNKIKVDLPNTGGEKSGDNDILGLDKIGKEMSDKINVSADFTVWYYLAIVAFLAAAYFCYKRMQITKT